MQGSPTPSTRPVPGHSPFRTGPWKWWVYTSAHVRTCTCESGMCTKLSLLPPPLTATTTSTVLWAGKVRDCYFNRFKYYFGFFSEMIHSFYWQLYFCIFKNVDIDFRISEKKNNNPFWGDTHKGIICTCHFFSPIEPWDLLQVSYRSAHNLLYLSFFKIYEAHPHAPL